MEVASVTEALAVGRALAGFGSTQTAAGAGCVRYSAEQWPQAVWLLPQLPGWPLPRSN